jgi:peptidoglycan/xylan/chitin deacetylase (PgdA/CDA1 family)
MLRNLVKKFTDSGDNKVIVLMYHRIANLKTDPWQLAVTAENFEQQLQVLKKHYHIVSCKELINNLKQGKIKQQSVCITFDDAYKDNYLYAKPLLEKYELPAIFFVPSFYIGNLNPFWWDQLENIILHSTSLPSSLSLIINDNNFEFYHIETNLTTTIEQLHKIWRWTDIAPTKRCELYLELWKCLQPLPYDKISIVIKKLEEWASYTSSVSTENLPMNSNQLVEMCKHPLFDIGVHTATHPALSYHSKSIQQQEMLDCQYYLENLSGRLIQSIAFPYGNYNSDTLSVVKEQQFSAGFTTHAIPITKKSDPFSLGRFQVVNQNGDEFENQLRVWMKSS